MKQPNFWDYPATPGFQGTDTSEQAAETMRPDAASIRFQCLQVLTRHALTADEVASRLNLSVLTVRPRITELNKLELIEDAGERRKNLSGRNAIVWRPCKASGIQ